MGQRTKAGQLLVTRQSIIQLAPNPWPHFVLTGGGLLFGGDTNGRFMALDHRTGEVLWRVNLGSPVNGFRMTYTAVGRRYVAVSTVSSATTAFLKGPCLSGINSVNC